MDAKKPGNTRSRTFPGRFHIKRKGPAISARFQHKQRVQRPLLQFRICLCENVSEYASWQYLSLPFLFALSIAQLPGLGKRFFHGSSKGAVRLCCSACKEKAYKELNRSTISWGRELLFSSTRPSWARAEKSPKPSRVTMPSDSAFLYASDSGSNWYSSIL